MSNKNKYGKIVIHVKKPWEVPTGHHERRAHTVMDSRPKRGRTRQGQNRRWRDDQ